MGERLSLGQGEEQIWGTCHRPDLCLTPPLLPCREGRIPGGGTVPEARPDPVGDPPG